MNNNKVTKLLELRPDLWKSSQEKIPSFKKFYRIASSVRQLGERMVTAEQICKMTDSRKYFHGGDITSNLTKEYMLESVTQQWTNDRFLCLVIIMFVKSGGPFRNSSLNLNFLRSTWTTFSVDKELIVLGFLLHHLRTTIRFPTPDSWMS